VGEKLNRHTLHSLEHPVHSSRKSPASSKRFGLPRRPLPDCVARASTRAAAEKAPLVSRCSRLISRASAGRFVSSFQLAPSAPAGASQPHSHETRESNRPPNLTGVGSPLPATPTSTRATVSAVTTCCDLDPALLLPGAAARERRITRERITLAHDVVAEPRMSPVATAEKHRPKSTRPGQPPEPAPPPPLRDCFTQAQDIFHR
jgi:hypothetical protein